MFGKFVLHGAVMGATALLIGSPVAHANPATSMATIDAAAGTLCQAITAHPNPHGVEDGLTALNDTGLDELDGAMVLISAVHHVCPQHEDLLMGLMDSAASEELCGRETWWR